MEESGFDFTKEHDIDFNIDFDHWPLSTEEQRIITKLYPNCQFVNPEPEDIEEGENIGYVQFYIKSKVTYELVMNIQKKTTDAVHGIGGWCESWGVLQE
jgi:hypothetical protein